MAEHGPDRVGLKDVARAAGVSHALVSHYFGTYDGLVDAVISEQVQRQRAAFLEKVATAGTLDPERWLEELFEALGDPEAGRVVAWALLTGRLDRPDAVPRREQGLKRVTDGIGKRLAAEPAARALGRAELEETVLLATAAIWGYALGRNALWAALGKEASPARDAAVRRRLAMILWQALVADGEPPARR
jgi:AcrR family transcriptional regulator